ncbi:RdgB/HAM1 family non-canonical purine NTP pyrophosphatase [Candidatus Woesearchaeota archaeon]|nr:RdgB/HAM1 family non-canonical purine NTP pyrophosphatase [Candidatus Woesearchaeota archaeon]
MDAMKIYFATHNKSKVKEFGEILKGIADVKQLDDDYPELRSDLPEEIVLEAVKKLAEKYKKPMVAEDSGLFIKALNGFPGTCSAYIHKRIGLKGILKLMEGIAERECEYRSAVGYCEPGKDAVSFLGIEKGKIADSERGKHGFGHDPIFIPAGNDKTYGEMENAEKYKKFRKDAVLKLMHYLRA